MNTEGCGSHSCIVAGTGVYPTGQRVNGPCKCSPEDMLSYVVYRISFDEFMRLNSIGKKVARDRLMRSAAHRIKLLVQVTGGYHA